MEEKLNDQVSAKKKINRTDDTNIDAQTEISGIIDINSFSYFVKRDDENPESFNFSKRDQDNINRSTNEASSNTFLLDAGKYKYIICILLKDDRPPSSALLDETLKGIKNNFGDLSSLQIKYDEIIIFVFVNQITGNYLIDKNSIKEHLKKEKENYYLKTPLTFKDDNRKIKINIISKKYYMSDIESLRCFYYYIVKSLKRENNKIITSVITAGVVPNKDGLKKLIQISFSDIKNKSKQKGESLNSDKKYAIAVPALEVMENEKESNLYKKIAQYERVHFNVYSMNFYSQTASVPISSLLNTMIIDDALLNDLSSFYSTIELNSTIDYHDYRLGLFLVRNAYKTLYYSKEILGEIIYSYFNFSYYQDNWINKYSGYYGNFFQIWNTFIFCANIPIICKVFMLFQIIGLIIEFIYPGLSLLVIYSVFIEAFGKAEFHSAVFLIMLYLIMYLAGGAISMTSKSSRENYFSNFYIYVFMEIYYLLIIICSIVAMVNLSKENKLFLEEYKFNKVACAILIILTFIVAIIPIILKVTFFTKNFVQMIFYLFLGAPSSTSSFLIAKIWKAPEASGGSFVEEKKGITVLAFFLSNLFFGCLCFFNYSTKLRANCVMGLSIAYLIYLFFKVLGIIFPVLFGASIKEDKKKEEMIINEIVAIKDELGSRSQNIFNDRYNDLRNSTDHLNPNNEQGNSREEEGEGEGEEKLDNEPNIGNDNNYGNDNDDDRGNDSNINAGNNNSGDNNNSNNNGNTNNGDNNNDINSNSGDNNNGITNNGYNNNSNDNNDINNNSGDNNGITNNGDNNNNSNNSNNSNNNNGDNNNDNNNNNNNNGEINSNDSNFNIMNNSENNNSNNENKNDNDGSNIDDQDRYQEEHEEEFKNGE